MNREHSGRAPGSDMPPSAGEGVRIGGMALENGLLLHGPRSWAAAVREPDGAIRVASGAKPLSLRYSETGGIPVLRGLLRLADGLAVIPIAKSRLRAAVLPLQSRRMLLAIGGSTAGAALWRRGPGGVVSREVGALVLGLAPTLLALRGSELAAYHGAEHKSIGEYELAVVGGEPRDARKEHERCGSNLVGPLAVFGLLGNIMLRATTRKPPPPAVAAVALLSAGAAMEVFRWMSRHPDSTTSQVLSWPGHALQHGVTTREPTEEQMEVARAALAEILRLEGMPDPSAA